MWYQSDFNKHTELRRWLPTGRKAGSYMPLSQLKPHPAQMNTGYGMIGECNLQRERIAAPGRLLIMCPVKRHRFIWQILCEITCRPGAERWLVKLLFCFPCWGLFYISYWNLRGASRQSGKIKSEATSENTVTVHKKFIVTEDRCYKILMREVEIGLIAKLHKFVWTQRTPHLLERILYHPWPLLASERRCAHCYSKWEVNNEVDSVALRAEARGRINVRVELIDYCALPTSLYEDEGLLIKSKTKKRW